MLELTNLKSKNLKLAERDCHEVKGGGAFVVGTAGFASGFLGSLANSASGASETGSFGFPNVRNAASTGLATGLVGATLGSFTGASLAEDS